jgi:hypothetical protein
VIDRGCAVVILVASLFCAENKLLFMLFGIAVDVVGKKESQTRSVKNETNKIFKFKLQSFVT